MTFCICSLQSRIESCPASSFFASAFCFSGLIRAASWLYGSGLKIVSLCILEFRALSEGKGEDEHMLHQSLHVSSTEQLGDERLRREPLKIVEVLSSSEEDDGSLGGGDAEWRERREVSLDESSRRDWN